ncbi:hypothetical protein BEWA_032610 [Theileria equi strain WA]|uniref:Uncharacterized protein n=1 Tax=Theileria equi strain WA TaxID=1537102 RepID=L0AYV6_THEEQ|nr:hypothetical protein BEWA_032610 [Theileria equi strain WA]AFZ80408.1 hypothetical protein BEWA_032610 [Theileria equi strain WA]|eukprot:XP_004830074.1 hypothetical protein BEWA_032610 [Theileria equi strain WA]
MSDKKEVTIDFDGYPESPIIDSSIGNTYTYKDDATNEQVEIIHTENPPNLSGYEKLEHKPKDPKVKIKDIQYSTTPQTGFPPTLSQYPSVTVYCWGQDYRPLVVKLGNENIYYISEGEGYTSNKWNSTSTSFAGLSLLEILQIKSCTHTNAHVVDISKTTKESYNCPSCNKERINVSPVKGSDYSWYGHTLQASSISGFKDDNQYQAGFKIFKDCDQANVYWYPESDGKPLLVCIKPLSGPGDEEPSKPYWYRRECKSSNKWVREENDAPTNEEDPKILELLQKAFQTAQNPTSQGNSELSTSISSSATNGLVAIFIVGIVPVILVGIGYAGWSFLPRL